MHLHSHFNLCARRRPTGPQNNVACPLCAHVLHANALPACLPAQYTQDDVVAVVVVTSSAVVAFFCLCCL